jgi:hypothetical protein
VNRRRGLGEPGAFGIERLAGDLLLLSRRHRLVRRSALLGGEHFARLRQLILGSRRIFAKLAALGIKRLASELLLFQANAPCFVSRCCPAASTSRAADSLFVVAAASSLNLLRSASRANVGELLLLLC